MIRNKYLLSENQFPQRTVFFFFFFPHGNVADLGNCDVVLKFEMLLLCKVGTLDTLLALSDDLSRLDTYAER